MKPLQAATLTLCFTLLPGFAQAGAQKEEVLAASVQAVLQQNIADQPPEQPSFSNSNEATLWLSTMSRQLEKRMPDKQQRMDFLNAVHYESRRAGLDPQMVLGLIEVESGFRKYAVSKAGARGYMQVMPFWTRLIGTPEHNLFHLRMNLRYGCTILRHYLDMEQGNLFRALGRYNGSLGKPDYPNRVRASWQHWRISPLKTTAAETKTPG